ncbi:DUF4198 domain-containing protein [Proteus faecis]|uniref:DUF4198 domain-containing protein n=1 Tax=Proteus faecis TaxID=2050967 RepID=UPI00301D1BD2
MKKLITVATTALVLYSSASFAHFQMIYTPESALSKGANIPLVTLFTHPFSDEHTMDMGTPESFYVVHKDKTKDLKDSLQPIQWQGNANRAQAYKTDYKARGMGDHVFVLTPAPYYEKSEGAYIQQITKVMVNVAGLPTDWDKTYGLKAEIVPLTKPYSIWTNSTFSGVVMSEGKPVPFADIEVEYLNSDMDLTNNKTEKTKFSAPQDSFITLGIKADENGKFTFGIPKSGWWGFAAMGVGPDTTFNGKELSQDGVIWVQAKDMDE